MSNRAAMYIDGFNLYHAIDDLGQPYLKWLNHWRLGQLLAAPRGHNLVKAVYCSAYYPGEDTKRDRHERYKLALENVGVVTQFGHYVHEDMDCRGCKRQWEKPTEKETDIAVALALMLDAQDDVFDVAYLISSDSDQAATARSFVQRFGETKQLISVSPPDRKHSQHILRYGAKPVALDFDILDKAVFEQLVPGPAGKRTAIRPAAYAPPEGWVHPNQRPSKAKPSA